METWITVREAAELSNYTTEYIRKLIDKQAISAQKRGWQWMVSKESLDQYLQSRKDQERQT
jgi:excisionase family DNA binding protein